MGIIQPPWIDKEFFESVPFNYCDHFGDKEELAKMCIICKEDLQMVAKYKKQGKDPYAWENVFAELKKSFAVSMMMLTKMAKEMNIDIDNLDDVPEREEPHYSRYTIYKLVNKYSRVIRLVLMSFQEIPLGVDSKLLIAALDAFTHSEHFIIAKIRRAIWSRSEERKDRFMREACDSQTSALFAYMAIDRNAKAFAALANHKPLYLSRKKFKKLSKQSFNLTELIHQEFFPEYDTDFEEYGVESYNSLFG